jgi:hypothetical protein
MSLSLLLPLALSALLALAVPLLLHLARREQQRRTVFAALRWLRARPRPRRRIRFDEWPLLVLRLLLLALLALWLAHPVLTGAAGRTPWVVVAPGLDPADAQRATTDVTAERRWLAPGFPALDTPLPETARVQPLASLLRELDAQLPPEVPLRVVVPARPSGLDGGIVRLSREVDWIVAGDVAAAASRDHAPFDLAVRHGAGQADTLAVRALRAALRALAEDEAADAPLDVAGTDTPVSATTRRLAWLAPGPLPGEVVRWIEAGGDALLAADVAIELPEQARRVAWRDAGGAALVEEAPMGAGRVMRFVRPLQPGAMPQLFEPTFPRQLRMLFETAPAPTRADAHDVAPVTGAAAGPVAPRDLRPWLAVLIALLLLAERWLATSVRREARP